MAQHRTLLSLSHPTLSRTRMDLASWGLVGVMGLGLAACGGSPSEPARSTTATESSGADQSASLTIDEVLAMPHRSEANRARDRYRHPRETLAFFGITRDMTVLELSPGGGWYTEVLAPFLRGHGRLIAAIPTADSPNEYRRTSGLAFRAQIAERAEIYGPIETVSLSTPETIALGEDASVDAVLTFRNLHNWFKDERMDEVIADAFRVLRPGGVFGVVEHRAAEGTDVEASRDSGYMPQAWVIEHITAAGFVLEERSEINANPNDTHDHPNGVWSLPPVLRGGDVDRDRFVAIGESDRMTLRFRKPE
jgi:predicted methyltransferase